MKKNYIICSIFILQMNFVFCASSNRSFISDRHTNLLTNGNFSDSLHNWKVIGQALNTYHPEDPGRADFIIKDGVLEVNIKNSGNGIYSIMLYQPVSLKKDSSYNISFYARSDTDRSIISNITQDVTWNNFSGDRVNSITKTMTRYSWTFKMTQNCEVLFQFCLGGTGTGSIFINDIMINEQTVEITEVKIQNYGQPILTIYPNPAYDEINIEVENQTVNKIEILNLSGQMIFSKSIPDQKVQIQRNNIPGGIYICNVYSNIGCSMSKIFFK